MEAIVTTNLHSLFQWKENRLHQTVYGGGGGGLCDWGRGVVVGLLGGEGLTVGWGWGGRACGWV